MKRANRAAIVLAAGKGTRMKSRLAKVLHEANGLPLAWYPIKRALELRCDPVVVVVGHQGEEVRASLERHFPDAPLRFVIQEEQRGTGHAVLCAKRALRGHDGRVLILYGDVPLLTAPTLRKLMTAGKGRRLALLSMRPADPAGYGRVIREGRAARAIVEHKDASAKERQIEECNAGIYDCDAKFLWRALAKVTSANAQGEYYLTDLVAAAWDAKEPAAVVEAPIEEVQGVNDRVELASASRVLRLRIAERHMRAGASLIDPETTYIGEQVKLGVDVIVEPNVRLEGSTRIGAGSRIGFGSLISESAIGREVEVRPYSVLDEATVGEGSVIGPFARLRPESRLGAKVRIGNFVEIKKSTLGDESKANHLAYLGDASIGKGCNVGAGTITCNYDGTLKHRTELGDGVFIGSDTQLVAPVKIGKGAYVAAGSTVVEDVPAGALALSRQRQVNKEGWVELRRLATPPPKARQVGAAAKTASGKGGAAGPAKKREVAASRPAKGGAPKKSR